MQLDTGLHTGGVGTAPFKLVRKGCSSIQSCTLVGWVQLPSSWWGGDAARYRAAHWWGGYSSLQAGGEGMQLDTELHTGGFSYARTITYHRASYNNTVPRVPSTIINCTCVLYSVDGIHCAL